MIIDSWLAVMAPPGTAAGRAEDQRRDQRCLPTPMFSKTFGRSASKRPPARRRHSVTSSAEARRFAALVKRTGATAV
jgi:hypothetical protein